MTTFIRYPLLLALIIFYAQSAFAITPGVNWKDSYSVDGQCYCDTTYDHDAGDIIVTTPVGDRTVQQICETIGAGPGAGSNPIYNDVQCGNGPPNSAIDEVLCPGRVDIGSEGCNVIGPTWNLTLFFPEQATETSSQGIPSEPVVTFPVETNPPTVTPIPEEPAIISGTTTKPVGLSVAASDFSSKDNRWVLIDAQALGNTLGPDSDGPHVNSALSGKYLELLPDIKVTDVDEAAADNVWPIPGDGPQVHFIVNIEQAGTYAVYVHAFSTGEFDDTVHAGIDGQWQSSGSNINTCGTRGKWIWTLCDNVEPATIDIPTSGLQSIEFSAHDDGFEFDQFVLQLLNDDGSTAVQPVIQLQAQNGVDSQIINSQVSEPQTIESQVIESQVIDSQMSESTEPELGQAVQVGVGSIGFASAPIAFCVLLISALCALLHRYEATAKDGRPTVRSGRQA